MGCGGSKEESAPETPRQPMENTVGWRKRAAWISRSLFQSRSLTYQSRLSTGTR
jgi:hypothetical protein